MEPRDLLQKKRAIDESKFTNKVSVTILKGASAQGNPDYDPDTIKASTDALVTWTNQDIAPHSATSGSDPQDAEAGRLFNSGMLNPGQNSIPANKLGQGGEYAYFCTIHPYMTGKITIG